MTFTEIALVDECKRRADMAAKALGDANMLTDMFNKAAKEAECMTLRGPHIYAITHQAKQNMVQFWAAAVEGGHKDEAHKAETIIRAFDLILEGDHSNG